MVFRFLLLIVYSAAMLPSFASETHTLRRVEWERDSARISLLHLRFLFDTPPNYYPAFPVEKPPAIHLDFGDTQVDSKMVTVRSVPSPLANLTVLEKRLKDGTKVTQVNIGVERTFPFFTRLEGNVLTLSLEVSSAFKEQKVLMKGKGDSTGNYVENISIQEMSSSVEILVTLARSCLGFSAYMIDEPARLVIDLPDVNVENDHEQDVDISNIKSMKPVKSENFSSLVFTVKEKTDFKTVQKHNRISVLFQKKPSAFAGKRRWIYMGAGALMLGGLGGAVILLGGDAEKPPTPASGDPDWEEPPPNPDDVIK